MAAAERVVAVQAEQLVVELGAVVRLALVGLGTDDPQDAGDSRPAEVADLVAPTARAAPVARPAHHSGAAMALAQVARGDGDRLRRGGVDRELRVDERARGVDGPGHCRNALGRGGIGHRGRGESSHDREGLDESAHTSPVGQVPINPSRLLISGHLS
jgi:hypothetical protein